MRAACRMSRTIDPSRPQELTTAQSLLVNEQPEVLDLACRRDELSRQLGRPLLRHKGTREYCMYKKLGQELAGAKRRARDALLSEIQRRYDREQPMLEIQRQLSGVGLVEKTGKSLKCSEELPPPQKHLIESLLTLPRPTLEEEMARRTEAIDAVAAFCLFEEGDTCRLLRDRRSPQSSVVVEPVHDDGSMQDADVTQPQSYAAEKLAMAMRSVTMDKRPLFCFICLGQPTLDLDKRTQKFWSHGDVTKHIKRKHLQYLKAIRYKVYHLR